MDDLISRKALISHIENQIREWGEDYDVQQILGDIEDMQPQEPKWIPVSERLPEDSGDYLVCPSNSVLEDYPDFSEVMIMPYDADCEAFGWWTERYDPISLGFVDSDFNEFEIIAWMPLPKSYLPDTNIGNMSENPTGSEPQNKQPEISNFYGLKSYVRERSEE